MRESAPQPLTTTELETLRKVSASGADRAAQALSQLTGLELAFRVPDVRAMELDEVPRLLGGEEAAVVALHLAILGDTRGSILIALDPASAARLLGAIVPSQAEHLPLSPRQMTELELSGLLEMGNILGAAYLNALSHYIQKSLISSVPSLAVDMAGAVIDHLLIDVTRGQDRALVIETELKDRAGDVVARILLLPDPETLHDTLGALRQRLRQDHATGS